MLRKRGPVLIGHAPIVLQLDWCQAMNVKRAIFTHCGSQITRDDPDHATALVAELGRERGIEASLAYDGLRLAL